jgi:hypothetical protein
MDMGKMIAPAPKKPKLDGDTPVSPIDVGPSTGIGGPSGGSGTGGSGGSDGGTPYEGRYLTRPEKKGFNKDLRETLDWVNGRDRQDQNGQDGQRGQKGGKGAPDGGR